MRRFFLSLVLLITTVSAYSQVSYGGYTVFPDAKLYGYNFKPQISFAMVEDMLLFSVLVTSSGDYASYDENSRILLKFGDDDVVKLPMLRELDVIKDYSNEFVASTLVEYYMTATHYEVPDDVLDRIVKQKKKITKIRIVFSNGDVADYDIPEKYQPKLISGLNNSYNNVLNEDAQRKKNISSDDDF